MNKEDISKSQPMPQPKDNKEKIPEEGSSQPPKDNENKGSEEGSSQPSKDNEEKNPEENSSQPKNNENKGQEENSSQPKDNENKGPEENSSQPKNNENKGPEENSSSLSPENPSFAIPPQEYPESKDQTQLFNEDIEVVYRIVHKLLYTPLHVPFDFLMNTVFFEKNLMIRYKCNILREQGQVFFYSFRLFS